MKNAARVLVAFVGLEHLGFLVLEMFLWTRPTGMRIFGLTPEFAEASASLAANQGLYNGFLAVGLLWGLWRGERGRALQIFFLVCVVVAGVFGALTAKPSILLVQAVPGLLALGAVWGSRRGGSADGTAPLSGPPHHLDLSVGDPRRSIPFYAALLESLGYRRWRSPSPDWQEPDPQRATWRIAYPGGGAFEVEVRPARPESRDRAYDRHAPGPHHLAFHAAGREGVDRAHRAMVAIGADVLDPPADYGGRPGYGEGYYAVFFADPDGVKLEVVSVPDPKDQGSHP